MTHRSIILEWDILSMTDEDVPPPPAPYEWPLECPCCGRPVAGLILHRGDNTWLPRCDIDLSLRSEPVAVPLVSQEEPLSVKDVSDTGFDVWSVLAVLLITVVSVMIFLSVTD